MTFMPLNLFWQPLLRRLWSRLAYLAYHEASLLGIVKFAKSSFNKMVHSIEMPPLELNEGCGRFQFRLFAAIRLFQKAESYLLVFQNGRRGEGVLV